MDENKLVGEFNQTLNDIVGASLPLLKIFCSKGLTKHLLKRKHYDCIKHIEDIPAIIKSPDYVGINPNEPDDSIELVKIFEKNVLIGIKFDRSKNYLYVSSMYTVQNSKIERRLFSGRLKKYL